RQSGADGVMIGRGAYGRPWLIAQTMAELGGGGHKPNPSLDEQLETMLEQYDDMLRLYGTHTGVNLARKHFGWYTKGLPGSAVLLGLLLVAMLSLSAWLLTRNVEPGTVIPPPLIALLLISILLPAIALMALYARKVAVRRAEQGGLGSGRLHIRLVALFTAIA